MEVECPLIFIECPYTPFLSSPTGKAVLGEGDSQRDDEASSFPLTVMLWILGRSGWLREHLWRVLGCRACGSPTFPSY